MKPTRVYYSYAHVEHRDPLSGYVTHSNVGWDGPDLPWVAHDRAERIAAENRADHDVYDAYAVVVQIDSETGEELRSWMGKSRFDAMLEERMADLEAELAEYWGEQEHQS